MSQKGKHPKTDDDACLNQRIQEATASIMGFKDRRELAEATIVAANFLQVLADRMQATTSMPEIETLSRSAIKASRKASAAVTELMAAIT